MVESRLLRLCSFCDLPAQRFPQGRLCCCCCCCPLPWIPSPRDLYRTLCHVVQICSLVFLRLPTCGSQENCLSAFCTDIILCFSDFKTHYGSVSGIYKERFEGIISFSLCPCVETYVSVKPKNSSNQLLAAAAGSPEEMGESESGVLYASEGIHEQQRQGSPWGLRARFPQCPIAMPLLRLL